MELWNNLMMGFSISLTGENLLYCLAGCFVGQLVGVLPGIGAPTAVALLLPLTFSVNPTSAIILFAGIYYGVAYGGTITSVLINVPGESSSVMTCLDGYQMAKQGRPGPALSIAAIGSWIAGTLSVILLMSFAPALAKFALRFGPPEYFGLAMMAFGMLTVFGGGDPMKIIISTLVGLFISCIGLDVMSGVPRYAFGTPQLMGGIDFIVIICGIFGLAEVFNSIEQEEERGLLKTEDAAPGHVPHLGRLDRLALGDPARRGDRLLHRTDPRRRDHDRLVSRLSRREAGLRHPEKFGTGAIEGVASPEAANNAASISGFAPLLALGVPGSPTTAVMLAGFMMWGIRPGPLLFQNNADLVWGLISSKFIGNLLLLLMNIFLIPVFVSILRVPYTILMCFIVIFASVGAFTTNNNLFDVWMMLGFGILGYIMNKLKYPIVPLVLALVLGRLAENSLRQSLMLSGGDFSIFFTRPISLLFMVASILAYLTPVFRAVMKKLGYGKVTLNVESL